ncbi:MULTISPECIES: AraC family transcriptional regulator [Paenibacillus]|uniref:AraC family transcriptional regulator n=1 Tax=Paenibacillus lautus TaxID=1401 RepID=A0A1R1ANJ4_PAELA|nr:AraC family transcriptional regulator [Paenibacillus lautus]OME87050.1 AraC family transcriptional regulator [Paenibacillus lautus]
MSKISLQQKELAGLIKKFTEKDGDHNTLIPSLHLIQDSNATIPICRIQKPSLCIVAQGEKIVILGKESYTYGVCDYLAVSLDVPISGQAIKPSSEEPFLSIRLDLDASEIFEVMKENNLFPESIENYPKSLFVGKMNNILLDAVIRLVRLLETPKDTSALAPLIIKEILYRLLNEKEGDVFKQTATNGSHFAKIAEVVDRIKTNFNKPLRVKELAQIANISSSSLNRYFKQVTAMTPVQYQKQLRLQEGRRLLMTENYNVANTAFHVGYESPSQFSREYARLFGCPPTGRYFANAK